MRDLDLGDVVTLDRSVVASNADSPESIFMVVEKKESRIAMEKLPHSFYYIFSPKTGKIGPFQRGELDEIITSNETQ